VISRPDYFFAGAGVVLAPPEAGAAAGVAFVLAFFLRLCCALAGLCEVWLCAAGAAVLGFGCVAGEFPLFCASSPTAASIEVKINFFIFLLLDPGIFKPTPSSCGANGWFAITSISEPL
jgi:hypothetical protein